MRGKSPSQLTRVNRSRAGPKSRRAAWGRAGSLPDFNLACEAFQNERVNSDVLEKEGNRDLKAAARHNRPIAQMQGYDYFPVWIVTLSG